MKNFKRFGLLLVTLALALSVQSQTSQSLYLRNSNGNLFRYGHQAILTTTDGSAHNILLLPINRYEAGMLEVQVVGFDSLYSATMSQIVTYSKINNVLTLGTPANISAKVVSDSLTGATIKIDTSATGHNIVVKVTGTTGHSIRWIMNTRWIYRQ